MARRILQSQAEQFEAALPLKSSVYQPTGVAVLAGPAPAAPVRPFDAGVGRRRASRKRAQRCREARSRCWCRGANGTRTIRGHDWTLANGLARLSGLGGQIERRSWPGGSHKTPGHRSFNDLFSLLGEKGEQEAAERGASAYSAPSLRSLAQVLDACAGSALLSRDASSALADDQRPGRGLASVEEPIADLGGGRGSGGGRASLNRASA